MTKSVSCLLLLILALSGPAHFAGADDSENTRAEIQSLLDRRSAAVTGRERGAFLATVDLGAKEFSSAQMSWFDRIGDVPIVDYSLALDLDEAPEFTRQRDRDRYGPSVVVALVEERFRLKDFDEHAALNSVFCTFVKKGGDWSIASDRDLEDLGAFSARQPWDFEPVSVATSEHFMILTHPGESGRATSLLSIAEAALGGVERAWAAPWSKRVIIVVPGSEEELERLLDATFDVSDFVAVASSSVDLDEGWNPVTRVIVNPGTFLRRTQAAQTTILVHELVHVATRHSSGPFVTSVIEEGLAQFAEFERMPSLEQVAASLRSGFDGRLPEDSDFFTGGGVAIRRSYRAALSATVYMADSFGVDGVNRFYIALGAARIEPGTARYHLDNALRSSLGISLVEFERGWADAVRNG